MLIELKGIHKTYNNGQPLHVLKGIDLDIDHGEFVSVRGASGSGKSTLLNILGILDNYDEGEYLLDGMRDDEITPEARAQVDRLLKTHFRPEFLNRIDEIVYYKPLTRTQITRIVDLMLVSLNKRLADRRLHVTLTPGAMSLIIDQGFDPIYGARPLKRFLQSRVETLIARRIIAGNIHPGEEMVVAVGEDGELMVR